jgi:hypothetical protein
VDIYALKKDSVTQEQLDALVNVVHALNPMVVNSTIAVGGVVVGTKEFEAVCKAEQAFDRLIRPPV